MIDKLYANAACKLAVQAFDYYYNKVYGITCGAAVDYLDLLMWAYKTGCVTNTGSCGHCGSTSSTSNCNNDDGCLFCNLQANIGKAIKYCRDCKPKKYMEPKVTPNPDYTEWYNSQEYIDCLIIQLEESGYIEPMIDLCANMNIIISSEDACKMVASQIAMQQVDCFMVTDLQMQQACATIIAQLSVDNFCTDVDIDIEVS